MYTAQPALSDTKQNSLNNLITPVRIKDKDIKNVERPKNSLNNLIPPVRVGDKDIENVCRI